MSRTKGVFERISTQALVFVVGLMVVCWPVVAAPGRWSVGQLFAFLFVAWGLGVVVLFLIGHLGRNKPDV